MEAAMNESSHGEEQSDAAIQLEFQMDCHARRAGLAMTKPVSSLARSFGDCGNPARTSDGLLRRCAPRNDNRKDVSGALAARRSFAGLTLRGKRATYSDATLSAFASSCR